MGDLRKTPLGKLLLLQALIGGGSPAVERIALGNPLTFGTDLAKPLVSLEIPFTPIQQGSGDPSPENIRSIIPWNGLKVWNGGKNLLNPAWVNFEGESFTTHGITFTKNADGSITANGTNDGVSSQVYFELQGHFNGNFYMCDDMMNGTGGDIYCYNSTQGKRVTKWDGTTSSEALTRSRHFVELKLNETDRIMLYIRIYANETVDNLTFRPYIVSSTETDFTYEQFKPITDTDIVFSSPVYGGSAEIVSGAMAQTILFVSAKWKDFEGNTAYTDTVRRDLVIPYNCLYGSAGNGKTLCNVAKYKYNNDDDPHFYLTDAKRIRCFMPKDMDGETEITFACTLAEPIPLESIEPHQLTALIGNNTIWSDADGSMTCVYLVSSKYADEHPVGGLGFGFGFGSGSSEPDEPDDPENPDESEEPIIDDSENNQIEGEEP